MKAEKTDIWYAIVNPNAGSGKTLAQWRTAERMLYDRGIRYKFVTPETASDSTDKVKGACRHGYRNFIAVGGDGTVHQTLRSIVEFVMDEGRPAGIQLEDFKLAVLPIGSGNDWLRSHNVPHDHSRIAELISNGSFSLQDVVRVSVYDESRKKVLNSTYMANIGGYSFDANVCDVVNFQKANGATGKLMYFNALRRLCLKQKVTRAKLLCDGKEVFDDYLFSISVGNGLYSGGGLCQTPSAIMDDGLINIMLAPKTPLWKIIISIRKLLNKRIESVKFLKFYTVRKFEIIPDGQGELVEVDGEIIGRAPVVFEVIPEKINVLHVKPDGQDEADPSLS